jgi:hypothetical protein
MLIQMIARRVSGLPITLLELNTLAHVMCAMFMYVIWWYKPQNVNVPETINVDGDLALLMGSKDWDALLLFKPADALRPSTDRGDGATSVVYTRAMNEAYDRLLRSPAVEIGRGNADISGDRASLFRSALPPNTSGRKVVGSIANDYTGYQALNTTIKARIVTDGVVMLLPGQWLEPIPFTPQRRSIHLTSPSIEKIARISAKWTDPKNAQYVDYLRKNWDETRGPEYLALEMSNFITGGDLKETGKLGVIILLLCLLYGGVHATSWNGHFPTYVERTLWRVSSCLVAGAGLLALLMWLLVETGEWLDVLNWVVVPLWVLICLVYTSARLFLVTEAFISIRSLPVGAYDTVSWVNFLPHVG